MAAKITAVKSLSPGVVLADAVLSPSGKILLGKDVVLTSRHLSLLSTWDVQSVFIQYSEDTPPEDKPSENIPVSTSGFSSKKYQQFIQEYDSIVGNITQAFDFILKRSIIPLPHLKDTAGKIHTSIADNGLAVINYLLIKNEYNVLNFTTRHSVMVAFFAGIIARSLKWSDDEINAVALTGLLHDVGNLSSGKNSDSRIHAHIAESAVLLKKITGVPNEVILGVVQHRECIDGSGFPIGVTGQKIHPYAKIIAVADIFHNQAYATESTNPFQVMNVLANEMFGKLDATICHTFISQVRDSLLNSKILLSDGQEAEVIFFHPNGSCLPVVRTLDGQIIDIAQRGHSAVSRIVTPN